MPIDATGEKTSTHTPRVYRLTLYFCPAVGPQGCSGPSGTACDARESGCLASDLEEATQALELFSSADDLYGDDWPECCIDDAG